MQLQDILFSQGFGTRRVCSGLVQQGWVMVKADPSFDQFTLCTDASQHFETNNLSLQVQGVEWPYHQQAYILLNKPAGTECSQKPSTYPSIYTLLPPPLRQRPTKGAVQGVQAIGRLDQDTTGLLLLSDDGKFIHRLSSPKKHVSKVYQVTTKHPVQDFQVHRLLEGVVLDDSPEPVKAAACVLVDTHRLDLTLTEGKYHQVKRMIAAVSNRVEALHRSSIGRLQLPDSLQPGEWKWLSPEDLLLLADKG